MLSVFILSILICAAAGAGLEQYIEGGTEVGSGTEFPYQVYLTRNGSFVCSGVLKSTTTLLTAAHCVGNTNNMMVTCGKYDRSASGGQTKTVSSATQHADYNDGSSTYANNLAEVTVSSAFSLDTECDTATFPSSGDGDFAGHSATISGWGLKNGTKTQVLKKASVTVQNNTQCQSDWTTGVATIGTKQLCVKGGTGIAACNGDSGGPVTSGGKVVGIISFGNTGCNPSPPTVSSRMSEYDGWPTTG